MVSTRNTAQLASLSILFTTVRSQINPNFTPTTQATTTSTSATVTTSSLSSSGAPPLSTTPSSAVGFSSSSSTARASFTTAVIPMYLYRAVESLLDDFPSTRPNYLGSLAWPSTLAIGTLTYELQNDIATRTSTQSSRSATATDGAQRASATSSRSNNQNKDKKLSIILGVVIGFVALALMGVLFWFLARRKRKAGSFFMRRSTPSTSSTHSRRLGGPGIASHATEKSLRVRSMTAMHHDEPPLLRPGLLHHQSSRSTAEDMPFATPMEYPESKSNQQGLDNQRMELARIIRGDTAHRKSSSSVPDAGRMPPFSPASLHQAQSAEALRRNRQSDDVVSPISPSKSFEREKAPTSIVHYPSMDEVNDFDFAGDGRRRASGGRQNGWHPARQRIEGRHEMA